MNHITESSTFIRCQECELRAIDVRLKEEMNFNQCTDLGADVSDGTTVTIMNRLVTRAYLARPQFWTATQPKISPHRTIWELGRYMNIEILECIYVMIRQTGEDPSTSFPTFAFFLFGCLVQPLPFLPSSSRTKLLRRFSSHGLEFMEQVSVFLGQDSSLFQHSPLRDVSQSCLRHETSYLKLFPGSLVNQPS